MMAILARARFAVGAVAVCIFIALSAPASAQQRGGVVDPGASVVNEQTLLRQSPRIEGQIDQLDERARVLIQPAGRTWDHFHEVTLYWLGAIVILGTLPALAAAYFVVGRLRISAGRSGRTGLLSQAISPFVPLVNPMSF